MLHGLNCVDQLHLANRFVESPKTKFRKEFPNLLRDELEEIHHEFRLTAESSAQLWILGCDTYRTCVEVANTHHYAPGHDQRSCCESKLFGAEERGDNDVATRFELPIDLHNDSVAKIIQQQGLLGFCESEFPRSASMFQ